MENARTKPLNRLDWVDELTDQMARVPLESDVIVLRRVEESFPHRRLGERIVPHNRQVERALRAIFKGDANSVFRGVLGERFPKPQQLRKKILERFINGISAALVQSCFNNTACKAGHRFNADIGRNFDGSPKDARGPLRPARIEGIGVKSANGRNADVFGFYFGCELFGVWFPIRAIRSASALCETHPSDRTETKPVHPFDFADLASAQDSNTHMQWNN